MDLVARPPEGLSGTVRAPGDKSISHRAVMLGAMAHGTTTISNFLTGEDCMATIGAFRELGVSIDLRGTDCVVRGVGMEFVEGDVISVGNSGTTMRLLMGILAGSRTLSILTGDASIRRRPMGRVIRPLTLMGAHIHGRAHDTLAPIAICPADLKGVEYRSPVASAQVKSALLLAGLSAEGVTTVFEPHASRDHTERMLAQFGVRVERLAEECSASVTGGQRLVGRAIEVPGDISSAAFLLAAGVLSAGGEVALEGVGTNPTRDGVLEVLCAWGADLSITPCDQAGEHGEPTARLAMRPSQLRGGGFGGSLIPRLVDEVPILAFLAAFAEGSTEIRDAGELRVKESDRVATVAAALRQGGVEVQERPDGLLVHGLGPRGRFRSGEYDSHGDHRLAMSLCVAALRADGPVVVRDADCVATSFPGFAELLNSLSTSGLPWIEEIGGSSRITRG